MLLLLTAVAAAGCKTYTDRVSEAKNDVLAGRPKKALVDLNEALELEKSHQLPAELSGENTLTVLERATVLQSVGRYKLAARDMMIADQRLDWLDIATAKKAKLGKYLFSGSSVRYRAPPFERLMLNTLNLLNFAALRDWEDAKVEARRFELIEHFFAGQKRSELQPDVLAFGNYLGGAAFETAGDYREAVRRYARAWHYGLRYDRFRQRLLHLIRMTAADPSKYVADQSRALSKLEEAASSVDVLGAEAYRDRFVDGEALIVFQTGMVPYKKAVRMPIAQALTYSQTHAYGAYHLSTDRRKRARELAASGALKWVNFPELTESGLPPDRQVAATVDGRSLRLRGAVDVESQVEAAWKAISGPLMAAAITRMITRAVAGAATREGVEEASGDSTLGMLAQIAVEGGMAAADKPDTRSWSMLPARIRFARLSLEPGEYTVRAQIDGVTVRKTADVREVGLEVVNFSRYR
ncbi:MAG: hypothetical protein ABEL76_08300 [Bradymonadaceae bacterium]